MPRFCERLLCQPLPYHHNLTYQVVCLSDCLGLLPRYKFVGITKLSFWHHTFCNLQYLVDDGVLKCMLWKILREDIWRALARSLGSDRSEGALASSIEKNYKRPLTPGKFSTKQFARKIISFGIRGKRVREFSQALVAQRPSERRLRRPCKLTPPSAPLPLTGCSWQTLVTLFPTTCHPTSATATGHEEPSWRMV